MDIRIEEIGSQQVAGIRVHALQTEIGDKIGALLGEIMPQMGPKMAGAPMAIYHTWEGDGGEMEVAVPVQPGTAGSGRIESHDLPAGRAAVLTHVGPYEQLEDSWNALGSWIKEHDLKPRSAPWEQYVSDCSVVPPEKLETRIVWPID